MSELGMQNDEIEIRIMPKAFFSQCLKNSCLLQSVVSMYIFLKLPLKYWLTIELIQNKWVDFLAIFLTNLVLFFSDWTHLGIIHLTFNLNPFFGQTRSVLLMFFRHHHYHMHHYLGLEFPRICKLLGVTLLIGRVFHIGQLKQIFPVDFEKLLN